MWSEEPHVNLRSLSGVSLVVKCLPLAVNPWTAAAVNRRQWSEREYWFPANMVPHLWWRWLKRNKEQRSGVYLFVFQLNSELCRLTLDRDWAVFRTVSWKQVCSPCFSSLFANISLLASISPVWRWRYPIDKRV